MKTLAPKNYISQFPFLAIIIGAMAVCLLSACSPTNEVEVKLDDNNTIIYLVRHAEKITGPDAGHNPELSEAGALRAQTLAKTLSDKGITYIHSTDYIRTQNTAAPLAIALGLDVQSYDPRDLPGLAAKVKERGGHHLIVGHSNTTPQATAALGGDAGADIDELNEYDRLYKVSIAQDGTVTTTLTRYGVAYVKTPE